MCIENTCIRKYFFSSIIYCQLFSYYVYSNQSNYVCCIYCDYSALYGHRDWLIKYLVWIIIKKLWQTNVMDNRYNHTINNINTSHTILQSQRIYFISLLTFYTSISKCMLWKYCSQIGNIGDSYCNQFLYK